MRKQCNREISWNVSTEACDEEYDGKEYSQQEEKKKKLVSAYQN